MEGRQLLAAEQQEEPRHRPSMETLRKGHPTEAAAAGRRLARQVVVALRTATPRPLLLRTPTRRILNLLLLRSPGPGVGPRTTSPEAALPPQAVATGMNRSKLATRLLPPSRAQGRRPAAQSSRAAGVVPPRKDPKRDPRRPLGAPPVPEGEGQRLQVAAAQEAALH